MAKTRIVTIGDRAVRRIARGYRSWDVKDGVVIGLDPDDPEFPDLAQRFGLKVEDAPGPPPKAEKGKEE